MERVFATRMDRRSALAATAAASAASARSPLGQRQDAAAEDAGFDATLAVTAVDAVVADVMARSGVPGMAVAVIAGGVVAHLAGYGVRDLDSGEAVDIDTVFQLASVSKSLSATAIAHAVGDGLLTWDDPVVRYLPDFALADDWVTRHVTIADAFSHRTGLAPRAGDMHEMLDFAGDDILRLLRAFPPAYDFRDGYAYTNYALTAGGFAAASAAGLDWPAFMVEHLFGPLGMTSSDSDTDALLARANRASLHITDPSGAWMVSPTPRRPDRQSPAGGASASIADLARWATMLVGGGMLDGIQVIPTDALATIATPHARTTNPVPFAMTPVFYGLGVEVEYNAHGDVALGHSGAFTNGGATNFAAIPARGFAVVAISNGYPIGACEAISATLVDIAYRGEPSRDWYAEINAQFSALIASLASGAFDYSITVADAAPPRELDLYVGAYANAMWDDAIVALDGATLTLQLGATPPRVLDPWNGDTFVYRWVYEEGPTALGVGFTVDSAGRVVGFTLLELASDPGSYFPRVG